MANFTRSIDKNKSKAIITSAKKSNRAAQKNALQAAETEFKLYPWKVDFKLFSYSGSKYRFKSQLQDCVSQMDIKEEMNYYIEPFVGSGGSLFHILEVVKAKNIIINDINRRITNIYQQIKDSPEAVASEFEKIELFFQSLIPDETFISKRVVIKDKRYTKEASPLVDYYLVLRDFINNAEFDAKHAAAMIFVLNHNFNGLYSESKKKKEFNGSFNWMTREISIEKITTTIFAMHDFFQTRNVIIHNMDVYKLLERYNDPDTFVYLDPPYIDNTISYIPDAFDMSLEGQMELVKITDKYKYVMYSNHHHEEFEKHFDGYMNFERSNTISGKGSKKEKKKVEILAYKINDFSTPVNNLDYKESESSTEVIKNISLFANAGIGEYGTSAVNVLNHKIKTVIANELVPTRAEIYKTNYPSTNMMVGSIMDSTVFNEVLTAFNAELPKCGTFSPPCQGASGLNYQKWKVEDYRNQLIKSVFLMFREVEHNSLEFGYIENVTLYYKETIPAYIKSSDEVVHDYLIDTKTKVPVNHNIIVLCSEENAKIATDCLEAETSGQLQESYRGFKYYYTYTKTEQVWIDTLSADNSCIVITQISLKDYIDRSMKEFGYAGELQTVRGDDYGAPQIRARGYYIFYRKDAPLVFPAKLYHNSKSEYNGKTILDAFKVKNLIAEFETEHEAGIFASELPTGSFNRRITPHKSGKFYVDTAITMDAAESQLSDVQENRRESVNNHFASLINKRHKVWLHNTPEGESAFSNEHRIHRPYRIIEVTPDGKAKRNMTLVLRNDTKEYFAQKNVIDYADFITDTMRLKDIKEFGEGKRNWRVDNPKDRRVVEANAIALAKQKATKTKETYYVYIFSTGFERAIHRRRALDKPSGALTTSMAYGGTNSAHPIFDRTLTPAEAMALFGLGYTLNANNQYVPAHDFKMPKWNKGIKSFRDIIYTITGEAILPIVSKYLLEECLRQVVGYKQIDMIGQAA